MFVRRDEQKWKTKQRTALVAAPQLFAERHTIPLRQALHEPERLYS